MDKVFELYDLVCEQHMSYHKTLKGALEAMSAALIKITPALCRDYDQDDKVDFEMKYRIKTHLVKE